MKRHSSAFMLAALLLSGLNMRPLLTSVSPLLNQLRHCIGLTPLPASLLPALPMMMMGAVALLGAPLMQRVPARALLFAGLSLLALALLGRLGVHQGSWLVATATVGGVGIGIVQMAMPGLIRQHFVARSAAVTGLWAGALMGGGGLGAALSPWLSDTLGWQNALSFWAIPAVVALLLWLPVRLPAPVKKREVSMPPLWRVPRAWSLALSFGLVNGGYAICVAWLPDAFQQLGWPAQASGSLLAVMISFQVTGAILLPLLARGHDRRPLLIFSLLMQLVGMLGFLLAPQAAPWLWASIAGLGLGGAFPLALVLALDHLPLPQAAARLVAFMQGAGFIIAGCMPFIAGQLHGLTHTYTSVWLMQAMITVALILLNVRFHPRSYRRAFPESC